FGFTSQDAGRELLMKWHFPQEVCDAIVQYRKPLNDDASHLAQVLHLAAYLNACVREGRSKEEMISHFPIKVAMAAEVEMSVLNELEAIIERGKELENLAA
ncbi:MAG: HDOD domain-containing protein, partial [Pseudomonadota bacterium]|nr:HDOD domain-containing protein [Pseudomonadota bacterium]